MNIKEYLKQNLKLNIKEGYYGYEISLELEGDVIDTVVVPVLESNLGEEHDLL